MKPFDLEAAKAGAKVVTRDGRKVRLFCFDLDHIDNKIAGAVLHDIPCDYVHSWDIDGKDLRLSHRHESNLDLHMAPVKIKAFVSIYTYVNGDVRFSDVYTSQESWILHPNTPTIGVNILTTESRLLHEWIEGEPCGNKVHTRGALDWVCPECGSVGGQGESKRI